MLRVFSGTMFSLDTSIRCNSFDTKSIIRSTYPEVHKLCTYRTGTPSDSAAASSLGQIRVFESDARLSMEGYGHEIQEIPPIKIIGQGKIVAFWTARDLSFRRIHSTIRPYTAVKSEMCTPDTFCPLCQCKCSTACKYWY